MTHLLKTRLETFPHHQEGEKEKLHCHWKVVGFFLWDIFFFFQQLYRAALLEHVQRPESGSTIPAFQQDNSLRFKVSQFPVRQEELLPVALEIALTFMVPHWKQKLLSPAPTPLVDSSSPHIKSFSSVSGFNDALKSQGNTVVLCSILDFNQYPYIVQL